MRGNKRGLTLIEIMIAVAIIGILAGVAIPGSIVMLGGARKHICTKDRTVIEHAESMYIAYESRHSGNFQELVTSGYLTRVPVCPAGGFYSWAQYPVSDPKYQTDVVCSQHSAGGSPFDIYGTIIKQTSSLVMFDSGAILSLISDLKFVPNFDSNTVLAVLRSGLKAQTEEDGSALITLSDGTTREIKDVFGSWQYLKKDFYQSSDGMLYSGDYIYAGYGYISEGAYETHYSKKNIEKDESTGSYYADYESLSKGEYSGASLRADFGYIYEAAYEDLAPSRFTTDFDKESDGSYTGDHSSYYNQKYDYNYGYNTKTADFKYTYSTRGQSEATYSSEYSYSSQSGAYVTDSKGTYDYDYNYEFGDGKTYVYDDKYTYNGRYQYNEKTKAYESTYSYVFESGGNYTWNYKYDPATKTYTYTHTDNNTGRTQTYTYRTT